jgi:hypothetical protein
VADAVRAIGMTKSTYYRWGREIGGLKLDQVKRLKVPQLRPEQLEHVWAYDFVEDRPREGRKFRMLCVVDDFTREALAIRVARKLSPSEIIDVLADLFLAYGTPGHIRSDQGLEFVAAAVKGWIEKSGRRRPASRRRAHGKRLRRILRREAPGRAAERRAVQHAPRSAGADRALAASLQRGAATRGVRIPHTCPGETLQLARS